VHNPLRGAAPDCGAVLISIPNLLALTTLSLPFNPYDLNRKYAFIRIGITSIVRMRRLFNVLTYSRAVTQLADILLPIDVDLDLTSSSLHCKGPQISEKNKPANRWMTRALERE
jgi:hypothetical protein